LIGALIPLWLSALARGASSRGALTDITAWLYLEKVGIREARRRRLTYWLLNAIGVSAGVLLVTWWTALRFRGADLAEALVGWLLIALLVGHTVPLGLGERYAERLSVPIEWAMTAATFLLSPLLWLAMVPLGSVGSDDRSLRQRYQRISDDALRRLAHVGGNEEDPIEEDEREMIAGVLQLGDALAREVMVPRPDVVAVDVNTPMLDALTTFIQSGHSRIPVYRESIDNIVGILYAKDLLAFLRDGKTHAPLEEITREAYFVPESKEADKLLQELQQRRTHMAIVVDEYGGVAGLVTIEDLLEEIVGEIRDEYDAAEQPLIEIVSPYEAICNARVDLDDLNRQLSIALPTEESDTLGGLIYSRLGRIPEVGDCISVNEVEATVLSVQGQRIEKVRVILPRSDDGSAETSVSENPTDHQAGLLESVVNPLSSILHTLA
jgi:CBS domain containing-hemolysin-like protein